MGVLARVLLGLTIAGASALPASLAHADASVADSATPEAFDSAFFAPYSPNTAMDLLGHVPGFSIEDGGGAAANVLIDGQRPARSQPLNTVLSRIPAAQVVRVEILRGAKAAAAVPGRTTVANIIRSASAGDGLWSAGFDVARGEVAPRGSLTWNGRTGVIEYSVGATYEGRDRPQSSEGFTVAGDGALQSTLRGATDSDGRKSGYTAQASVPINDGGRLSFNGETSKRNRRDDQVTSRADAQGAPSEQAVRTYIEAERKDELGASLEQDVGAWSTNLDAVLNRVRFDSTETKAREELPSADAYGEDHANTRNVESALLRGSVAQEINDAQRVEFGVEHRSETVDAERSSDYSGPGWDSPNAADVTVEQEHLAAYATHLWRVAPHWSLETHIARETASLRFSDEIAQSSDVSYWTGSFQVAHDLGRRSQIRARIYRDAGPIDVEDLIVALADNPTPDGIPALQPDLTWHAELKTDLRFGRRGSVGLTLSRAWVEHALDWIVVDGPNGRFESPGNVGDADISALNLNLSTPIAPIPGASFSMSAGVANSDVTDAVTDAPRSVLGVADAQIWAEFRQEVPAHAFSWGISYYQQTPSYWLPLTQVGSYDGGPSVDAFVETTAIRGVKARFRASSVLDRPARVTTLDYQTDRAGLLNSIERTDNSGGTTFSVTLAGSF